MVYHNLSMSFNHHVPIFNCTVTRRGGLSLFTHLSSCKLTAGISLAFLQHTDKQTDRPTAAFGYVRVQSPPPMCDITCFGSRDLALYRPSTLVFELHIRCPVMYTTETLH